MMAAIIYTLLFTAAIIFYKRKKENIIPRFAYVSAFLIKIFCGFALTYIYTNYYPDRKTADIYKYYDDAKVMYSALDKAPGDYVKMVTGIGNNNLYFDTTYYTKMNNWYKRYDFGTYNDNHTIIRFNALIMPLSFGSFHVHTVFMCFISFVGLCLITAFFLNYFRNKKWLVLLAVFGIPSVMFWGSGVLKEGILLFSIGVLLYAFYKIVEDQKTNILNLFLLALSVLVLIINKNYLLIALLPPLICYACIKYFKIKRTALFFAGFHLILLIVGYVSITLIFNKKPLHVISQKQKDFINLANGGIFLLNNSFLVRLEPESKEKALEIKGDSCRLQSGQDLMRWKLFNFNDTIFEKNTSDTTLYKMIWELPKAGSLIQTKALEPTIGAAVLYSPIAVYNVLMKPDIFHTKSIIEKMAAVENIFLIIVLLVCVLFADFKNRNKLLINLCFYSVLILFLIIGFTTPVAGAIVRYKMPLLPFLLLIGINLISIEKLKKFRFRKK